MERIVVGVDGSDGSRRALQWAAEEAVLRGAGLEVVHAYAPAYEALEGIGSAAVADEVLDAPRVNAHAVLQQLTEDLAVTDLVTRAIESRSPAEALVELSRDAQLLVVSSRGHGSFKNLMLGSVSQQCAHHAECPVVIVRAGSVR